MFKTVDRYRWFFELAALHKVEVDVELKRYNSVIFIFRIGDRIPSLIITLGPLLLE